MNTRLLPSVCLFGAALAVQAQVESTQTNVPAALLRADAYSAADCGRDYTAWEQYRFETNGIGQVIIHTNRYVELETGRHHLRNGQWVQSREDIELVANGAVATNAPHRAGFTANINSPVPLALFTPDNTGLKIRPLALVYYDFHTRSNVLVAELKNADGLVVGTNQVLYPDAFTDFQVDVRYTCKKSGVEQDIILRQRPPAPEAFGFNPATTWLWILTEFIDPPADVQVVRQVRRGWMISTVDKIIRLGGMSIGPGTAFSLGLGENRANGVPMEKHWTVLGGRTFLIEEVKYSRIVPQLRNLQAGAQSVPGAGGRGARRFASRTLSLPAVPVASHSASNTVMQVASLPLPDRGLVLDFDLESGSSMVFEGGKTYHVSGTVNLTDAVIEGGTVVKYERGSRINLYGSVQCLTGPYCPAVFTAVDDNSVGDSLGTGYPTGTYADCALSLGLGGDLSYVNIRYANEAVYCCSHDYSVNNAQLSFCNVGFHNEGVNFLSCNILMYQVGINYYGSWFHGRVEHLTSDQAQTLVYDHDYVAYQEDCNEIPSSSLELVNTLTVAITNGYGNISITTNYVRDFPTGAGVFQTVGAGAHYLVDGSTNRNAGTTEIQALMADALKTSTTYPPIPCFNDDITDDTTLEPQAQRDTDTPDLGYHYDPLDYLLQETLVEDATVQVLPGTACGLAGSWGVGLLAGSHFISQGSPTNLNHLVGYNRVQELPEVNGPTFTSVVGDFLGEGAPAEAVFRFTDWSVAEGRYHFETFGYEMVNSFSDCQFHGGALGIYDPGLAITNCLFEGVNVRLDDSDRGLPIAPVFRNCLFRGGQLYLNHASADAWTFRDNLFDQATIVQAGAIDHAYNGYITNSDRLTPTNAHDVVAGLTYETGPLGNRYQPANSAFLDQGSVTNAGLVGLYHHTTQTDQAEEGAGLLDLGFHYAAIKQPVIVRQPISQTVNQGASATFDVIVTNTLVLSYQWTFNGTSLPGATLSSYTRTSVQPGDAGSYAVVVFSPLDTVASSGAVLTVTCPPSISTQPASQTLVAGTNVTFSVAASGTPPLAYQWRFNGTNLSGATTSTYSKTSIQLPDSGTYSVAVSNPYGSVVSSNALLTVLESPYIITQPANRTNRVGETAWLTVIAGGTAPLTCQWYSNSVALAGATNFVLFFDSVQTNYAASYHVVVSNGAGSVTSSNALLTISPCYPAVDVILVMDVSESMTHTSANFGRKMDAAMRAASNFVGHLNFSLDQAGVVRFSSSATLDQPLTNSKPDVLAAIYKTNWNYNTCIACGITNATGELLGARHNTNALPVMVVLSDGSNNVVYGSPPMTATNAAYIAKTNGIRLISIALGTDADTNLMRAIATSTTNDYYFVNSSNQLDAAYSAIAVSICRGTNLAPSVEITPTNLSLCPGSNATFTAMITGTSPFTNAWFKNGNLLSGQTNSSLTISNLTANDAGTYRIEVAGPGGKATNAAVLEVYQSVTISNGPVSLTNCPETTATFTVSAGGTGLSYQWYKANSPLTNQTSSSLTLTNVAAGDAGAYQIVVSGTCGGSVTNSATLTINQRVQVTDALADLLAPPGTNVTFGVGASGTALSYQWYKGTRTLTNRVGSSLVITNASAQDAGTYCVVVRGACGGAISCATLTLMVPPFIITQPTNQTVVAGQTAWFSVTAGGTTPLTYQWYSNSIALAGATNSLLLFDNAQTNYAASYRVVVSNGAGSVTSSNAVLVVNPAFCSQASSALVSWWRAESNALDSAGLNPGTCVSEVVYAVGKVGQAFTFNGSGNYMTAADSSSLRLTNQLTIEAWIKPGSVSGDQAIVSKIGGSGGNNGYQFVLCGDKLQGQFNSPGQGWPSARVTSESLITTGRWYHVAWTYDQSALRLYVNGLPVATNVIGAQSIATSVSTLRISGDDNNNVFFNGLIDEVAIYNQALADAEILALYNASMAGKCQESPAITLQPTNLCVSLGSNAVFTVLAAGTPQLRYQWRFNGADIAGATNTALPLPNVQSAQAGTYSVRVTNMFGSVLSSNALLTIANPAPVVWMISPANNQFFVLSPTNILLAAGATNSGGGAIAQVWFCTNNVRLGQAAAVSNQYQFVWQNVSPGAYLICAWATNDAGGFAQSTVITNIINAMPVVAITSPTNSTSTNLTSFPPFTDVVLHAVAYDADSTNIAVQFFYRTNTGSGAFWTNFLGSVTRTNGTNFFFTWTNCPVGTHAVYALATDTPGATATSELLVFQVTPINPPPDVWIYDPTNGSVFRAGADITIHAYATNGVLGIPVTNVEFFANSGLLGNDSNDPFSITECCWKPGQYTLRAKATDSLGNSRLSEQLVRITVANPVPAMGTGFWDPTFAPPWLICRCPITAGMAVYGSNLYCVTAYYDPLLYEYSDYLWKWDATGWEGTELTTTHFGSGPEVEAMVAGETGVFFVTRNDTSLCLWHAYGGVVTSLNYGAIVPEQVETSWYHPFCLKIIGPDLYLGGYFEVQQRGVSYFAKWNATDGEWDAVGEPLDGPVFAIETYEGDLVVGGCFNAGGGCTNLHNVARLKNGAWEPLGTGIDGTNSWGDASSVHCLAACGTNLFVGGDFTIAGGITNVNCVAIWNGHAWQRIGSGVGAVPPETSRESGAFIPKPLVASVYPRSDTLFVSGRFTTIWDETQQPINVSGVAKAVWSEAQQQWVWSDLDLGVYGCIADYPSGDESTTVASLQVMEGTNAGAYDVVLCGIFAFAGTGMTNFSVGQSSPYYQGLARWRVGETTVATAPHVFISSPANNTLFTSNPTAITVTATVSSITNITSVEFYADGNIIGTDTTSSENPYTQTWTDFANGIHQLKAIATDANGLRGESPSVLVSIKDPNSVIIARDDSFTIPQGIGGVTLPVLTNDTPAGELRVSRLIQTCGSLGTTTVSWDGKAISLTPFPNLYGSTRFAYIVTNSSGASDSAWVTINLQAKPQVSISNPADGDAFSPSQNVTLNARATDYDGQITNFTLLVNGLELTHTNSTKIVASWTTNTPGFHTFLAVAVDNDGLTNQSSPVTIVVTNTTASPNGPVAIISNLTETVTTQGSFTSTVHPVVREGFFDLQGSALDADGDPVAYAVLLFRPEDLDFNISGELKEALEAATPYADLTPSPLNPQGFHNGAVTNASLGNLDFTRFPNGAYYLVLRVRGGTDETNAIVQFQLDTQLKIGQFSFTEQDLVIPVNGIPLTIIRTYNSLNPRSADFGYSWTYSLMGMDVELNDERKDVTPFADDGEDDSGLPKVVSIRTGGGWDVTLTLPDGRRTTFAFDYNGAWPKLYAKWKAPDGVRATLTMLGNNEIIFGASGLAEPTWADSDLSAGIAPFENQDIKGWVLQTPDGTTYEIGRGDANRILYEKEPGVFVSARAYGSPALKKITQRSGDTIKIEANGIFHYAAGPNGTTTTDLTRSVWFERDRQNRITAIRDPNSGSNGLPVLKYVYNRNTGNLLQVLKLADRNAGTYTTNKYYYDNANFPHYLTSMENPLGVPVARNEYDDSGRLTAVVDADGKRTEFYHTTSNKVEVIIDRLGHTTSYAYDLHGNVTATTNALGEYTLMSYDTTNNLLSTTDALGHTTRYGYDDQGNRTMVADALNRTNFSSYDAHGNLIGTRDPLGNWTTNLFDEFGNLTNSIQKDVNGVTVGQSFSKYVDGLLVETRDANGNTNTTFGYDGSGNLASSTDARGLTHSFGYDSNGNQTSSSYTWTGPGGSTNVTTSTEYDAQGRVVRTIDALGNTNQTFYTALGKVDYTVDKLGNTNRFFYDARGNVVQTIGPDGLSTRTVYNEDGKPIYTSDRNGITGTRTDYDGAGRVTNSVRFTNIWITISPVSEGVWSSSLSSSGTPYATNATEYYATGWVKSRTGPDGQKTSYTYWDDGQTKTVTDPLLHVTYIEYDEAGRQRLVADALNHTNRFVLDAVGRNVKTIFADNSSVSNIFNLLGQQVGKVDQASLLVSNVFDAAGQLTSVVMPSVPDPETPGVSVQPAWTYRYDAYSRQYAMQDAKGRNTTNVFDALGRQLAIRLPMGETNWTKFDSLGRLSEQVDFKGQRKLFRYDRLGRVATNYWFAYGAAYPSNSAEFYYNPLGQLTNLTERSGTDASSGYVASTKAPLGKRYFAVLAEAPEQAKGGALGLFLLAAALAAMPRRLWSELAGIGRGLSLSLGERARVRGNFRLRLPGLLWRLSTYVTVFMLLATDPKLDFWSLRAECVYPPNPSTETTRVTAFAYDFEGRLKQVNSPEGVINYGYHPATGRHTSTCTTNSYVAYDYDELGRLKTVTVSKRNGVVLGTNEVTTYTYTDVGNRSTVELPNGVITTYLYDSLNRLTNLTHTLSGALLASYSYQLHPTGRRTNAVEILKQEDGTWLTNTLSWAYDQMYRLTNEVSISSAPANAGSYTNAYRYNKVGNRFDRVHSQNGATTTVTNLFNDNDQLLKEVTLVSGTATETNWYAYDLNGSLVAKTNVAATTTTVLYGYDLKNKLSMATTVGSGVTNYFRYNHEGIRVRSTVGASVTHYLIDANNHTGYAQILEELSAPSATATRSYVLGDDVLAQASSFSLQPSYFLYDGHGSTRQLIRGASDIRQQYNYQAYGEALGQQFSPQNPPETSLLYCGEQFDLDLQMYNLRARYYNPATATFDQRDTSEGNYEDPPTLHKYTYANNEPVNGTDPSGNDTLVEIMTGVFQATCLASMVLSAVNIAQKMAQGRVADISIWDWLGFVPFSIGKVGSLAWGSFVDKALNSAWGHRVAGQLTTLGERMLASVGRARGGNIGQLGTQFHSYINRSWLGRGFGTLRDWGRRLGVEVRIDECIPDAIGPGSRPDFTILIPRIGMAVAIDIKPVPKEVFDQGYLAAYNYLWLDTTPHIAGRRDGTFRALRELGYSDRRTFYLYIPYPSFQSWRPWNP